MSKVYITLFLLFSSLCITACADTKVDEDPEPPQEEEGVEPEPFKANRILIKHGLQLQCWVATDNYELGGKAGQPAYNLNHEDWKLTGFTAPTFFGPPLMNTSYFQSFPNSQWAMAKAPYGEHLNRSPNDFEKTKGFLSDDQKKYLGQLVTVCFGDEEDYKYQNVQVLKDWFDVTRKHYPDVLVHNNQFANQWSENNLRTYIKQAHPEMLVYDWYYFHSWDPDHYKGARDMAKHLKIYRDLSLEGLNGDKKDYLAFGQYSQGFVNEGTYKLTESQLRLYYYMTWTFGGKWLNWFRYLQGDGYGGQTASTHWALLLENGMPGHPSKYMAWANRCNQESKYIGDYLVRLKTTDVRYVSGSTKYTEGIPERLQGFNPSTSCIKAIKGSLVKEPAESADMYIGHYEIIPEEEKGDPSFFKNKNATFFMITNGYASKQEQLAQPLSQLVAISIDTSGLAKKKLYWINPENGEKEELPTIGKEDSSVTYQVSLPGGSGALFMAE